jgi:hypothetical protein
MILAARATPASARLSCPLLPPPLALRPVESEPATPIGSRGTPQPPREPAGGPLAAGRRARGGSTAGLGSVATLPREGRMAPSFAKPRARPEGIGATNRPRERDLSQRVWPLFVSFRRQRSQ